MRGHWAWLLVAIGLLCLGDAYGSGWLLVLAIPTALMALQPREEDESELPEDRWWK